MNTTDEVTSAGPVARVEGLGLSYGDFEVLRDITFDLPRGRTLVVMGGSGCGKSTLLKAMIGLLEPQTGKVSYGKVDFWACGEDRREQVLRRFGVLFQGGALWSSMTLHENIALPLETHTNLRADEIRDVVDHKLGLVGLREYGEFHPAQLSGGMRKRGGLARAMALDPEILFFDEPSAGLDPLSSRRLDDLILELKESLGITFLVVSHELPSIFTVADEAIFLDARTRTILARGKPSTLREECPEERVRQFLKREATHDNS